MSQTMIVVYAMCGASWIVTDWVVADYLGVFPTSRLSPSSVPGLLLGTIFVLIAWPLMATATILAITYPEATHRLIERIRGRR